MEESERRKHIKDKSRQYRSVFATADDSIAVVLALLTFSLSICFFFFGLLLATRIIVL